MTARSKPLGQIISESARGQHDAWPTDLAHPTRGSHEERFNDGDKQRVLWQIHDCAIDGDSIPEWAATAFCDALVRVMTCQRTWEQEFGQVPARGRNRRPQKQRSKIRHLAKNLIPVGEADTAIQAPEMMRCGDILEKNSGLVAL